MRTHLVVSISGHGFGHVAQTAPILNALHELRPQLHITVRSSVAASHLRSRIRAPFTHMQSRDDIGMVMSSPLEVDVEQSRAVYRAYHSDWDARVAEEARLLRELQADFVLSNVGYLSLAGARQAGIPGVALCSLNWADIYRHYCGDDVISRQIQSCYAGADAFLRTTPGMAMDELPNLIPVAPIAAIGTNRREELNHHLKLSKEEKLVLVSMGGIASRLPVENWPGTEGVRYLVSAAWHTRPELNRRAGRTDVIILESLPMNFSDLLASSDALICKPGYGSFVEAACCGVPVLYVGRPGWPESAALIAWLQHHGLSREISHDALLQGEFSGTLEQIWCEPKPAAVVPSGVEEAACWIAEKMG